MIAVVIVFSLSIQAWTLLRPVRLWNATTPYDGFLYTHAEHAVQPAVQFWNSTTCTNIVCLRDRHNLTLADVYFPPTKNTKEAAMRADRKRRTSTLFYKTSIHVNIMQKSEDVFVNFEFPTPSCSNVSILVWMVGPQVQSYYVTLYKNDSLLLQTSLPGKYTVIAIVEQYLNDCIVGCAESWQAQAYAGVVVLQDTVHLQGVVLTDPRSQQGRWVTKNCELPRVPSQLTIASHLPQLPSRACPTTWQAAGRPVKFEPLESLKQEVNLELSRTLSALGYAATILWLGDSTSAYFCEVITRCARWKLYETSGKIGMFRKGLRKIITKCHPSRRCVLMLNAGLFNCHLDLLQYVKNVRRLVIEFKLTRRIELIWKSTSAAHLSIYPHGAFVGLTVRSILMMNMYSFETIRSLGLRMLNEWQISHYGVAFGPDDMRHAAHESHLHTARNLMDILNASTH